MACCSCHCHLTRLFCMRSMASDIGNIMQDAARLNTPGNRCIHKRMSCLTTRFTIGHSHLRAVRTFPEILILPKQVSSEPMIDEQQCKAPEGATSNLQHLLTRWPRD